MASEKWRLFFAVEIPSQVRARAVQVQRRLSRAAGGMVKWVEPENLHITLKFIGEVEAGKVEQVRRIGRQAALKARPMNIEVAGAGAFPSPSSVRVLWLGVRGDTAELAGLAEALEAGLEEAGICGRESRPFVAHLTLGRARRGARLRGIAPALAEFEGESFGEFRVESFVLMRSHLRPEGPVYEVVERFSLGG